MESVNFQTKRNMSDPLPSIMYTASTPPGKIISCRDKYLKSIVTTFHAKIIQEIILN